MDAQHRSHLWLPHPRAGALEQELSVRSKQMLIAINAELKPRRNKSFFFWPSKKAHSCWREAHHCSITRGGLLPYRWCGDLRYGCWCLIKHLRDQAGCLDWVGHYSISLIADSQKHLIIKARISVIAKLWWEELLAFVHIQACQVKHRAQTLPHPLFQHMRGHCSCSVLWEFRI